MASVQIPKYAVKQEIGVGGMATVYLAVDKLLNREVALKVMSPAIASTKGFQDSFIREARIVAELKHPNIVMIYEVGVEGNHYYMAMEYLPKGSLKQRLAAGKLPVKEAVLIIRQLANALSYAHQKGYVHRDIKPANILFRDNGEISLADFGIAKLQGTSTDMTQMGFITGTPHYMSPEQSMGQNIDQRSDLYSVGVVFYEMLTGKKPFTGANALAIAYEHLHTTLLALEGEAAPFQTLLEKALAKKPEERFATVAAFDEALAALCAADDETVIVPSGNGDTTVLPPVSPWRKWGLGLGLVAIVGVGGAYYVLLDQQQQALDKQQQALAATAREDQINKHLAQAQAEAERERFFDYAQWSDGCKQALVDSVGPYEAGDSAERHYREILTLAADNEPALQALEKLNNKRILEFSDCDGYQREAGDASAVDALFDEKN
ncbi:MAG: serine/threonine-protein kinase [Thiothrix litoralis]